MSTGGSKSFSVSGSSACFNPQAGHHLPRCKSVRLCTSLQSVTCLRRVCLCKEVEKNRDKSGRRRFRCKLGPLLPLNGVNLKRG